MTHSSGRDSAWAIRQRLITCAILLLAAGFASSRSRAQTFAAPGCASDPGKLAYVVVGPGHPDPNLRIYGNPYTVIVPGFPAQRLYIYQKSPLLCSDTETGPCTPSAYVITGNTLVVAPHDCDGWSYVHYTGRKVTAGWVASSRLGSLTGVPPARRRNRDTAVRIDHDHALCNAVLHGRVSGVPIYDTEPYIISREAFGLGEQANTLGAPAVLTIVARGRMDLDNAGRVEEVGILQYDNGGWGKLPSFETSFPIRLNDDGIPKPGSQFNLQMIEQAGADAGSWPFVYHGKTYFETQSSPYSYQVPREVVWQLSQQGRRTLCEFVPGRYEPH